jgi:predicted Fe-Mo cluster-binding NifX family protein
MVVCVPVTGEGLIDPRWGRAARVAIANVQEGDVVSWQEVEVAWGDLRDAEPEGSHHARVARFLKEHHAEVVIAHHMGEEMLHMLRRLGIRVILGAAGDAREAAVSAAR